MGYKLNDSAFSIDGVIIGNDTSCAIPLTLNRLDIGSMSGSLNINGTIARITYFPERLPDADLITLTQP